MSSTTSTPAACDDRLYCPLDNDCGDAFETPDDLTDHLCDEHDLIHEHVEAAKRARDARQSA